MNNLRFFKEKKERNEENKYLKINNWFFSLFLELVEMSNNFV